MTDTELKGKVEAALEEIRPFLQNDGGDISLLSIEDGTIVKVQLEDVMYTKLHGPEKGITNILVKQLEDVPITERPIHCADVKRKKFY